jgi:DNA processing protein
MNEGAKVTDRVFTLACFLAEGLGPAHFRELLSRAGNIENAPEVTRKLFPDFKIDTLAASRLEEKLSNLGIEYVCVWEDSYPPLLREIPDAPTILMHKGNSAIELLGKRRLVSIVGSRKSTKTGVAFTTNLAYELSKAGFVIVSGLAVGIDSAAHLGALQAGGLTVSVLPTSANYPSPRVNARLYTDILSSGGIAFSETLPGEQFFTGMFARRNRVIAGLSVATIIVEAGAASGALITASQARGYHREVFAVPGLPGSTVSVGCNRLIRDGAAQLITSAQEVLSSLGDEALIAEFGLPTMHLDNLPVEAARVYESLKDEPKSLEDICDMIDRHSGYALSLLVQLEIKGVVVKGADGRYLSIK